MFTVLVQDEQEVYYHFHTDGSVTSAGGHEVPLFWAEKGLKAMSELKNRFGVAGELPRNLKRECFESPTGHQVVYYTHWGAIPPVSASITYQGDKNRHKAWIVLG